MQNPIQTFEANTNGRDFVIGDLHGSLSALVNLLSNLKFDHTVDRLFSVGDLVDRGPDSLGCLELINEPWFKAVLANHEQMMVEAFYGGYMGQFWFRNGGNWGYKEWLNDREAHQTRHQETDKVERTKETLYLLSLLEKVQELPFVITVNRIDGTKIHIIHAELPPNWVITDEAMADPAEVMKMSTVQSEDGDFFLWGRHKFYQFCYAELSNQAKNIRVVKYQNIGKIQNDRLSHIVSGHTKVQRPLTILGQTNIDTAAHESYKDAHGHARSWAALTCIEINTWKFYQATETEFREVEPVVINKADLDSIKDQS